MSRKGSDEAQVICHDASAYFSKEEWKLLHDWQKDLYMNVMKEIHQALISLGPLITTTVVSLRAKEKQELCRINAQDSRGGHNIRNSANNTAPQPEGVFGKNEKEPLHQNYRDDTSRRERNNSQKKGSHIANKNSCLRTEEQAVIVIDHPGSEENEGRTNPDLAYPVVTAVFSLSNKDDEKIHSKEPLGRSSADPAINSVPSRRLNSKERTHVNQKPWVRPPDVSLRKSDEAVVNVMAYPGGEGGQGDIDPGPEIVSVLIKEEDEVESMDLQDSERIEHFDIQTSSKSMNRPQKVANLLKGHEETPPIKTLVSKASAKVTHNSHMEIDSRGQDWSIAGEQPAQCESSFRNRGLFDVYLGGSNVGNSEKYSECESNQTNSQFASYLPNTQQSQNMYTFPERDENVSTAGELGGQIRPTSRERTYACTECEKRFFEKSHLITHYRTHSGEKTFVCTFCHKTFNRKYNLDGHVRIHTGERPYKCKECEKDFSRKSDFNRHQKKHAGS
ncbi:zinc finger protein 468-like isoform X2 [Pleurodeles waltl]|uniref:zinc finger protein 468-like isoform X2 n=1 Tax=Pleurodeles waltl TaxID=8319 RepID=UPI0037095A4A